MLPDALLIPDALLNNAAILIVTVIALWAVSVRINDVSFIDSFWGAGMGLLAMVSWLQVKPQAGPLATLIMAMTAAWGLRLGLYLICESCKSLEELTRVLSELTCSPRPRKG